MEGWMQRQLMQLKNGKGVECSRLCSPYRSNNTISGAVLPATKRLYAGVTAKQFCRNLVVRYKKTGDWNGTVTTRTLRLMFGVTESYAYRTLAAIFPHRAKRGYYTEFSVRQKDLI